VVYEQSPQPYPFKYRTAYNYRRIVMYLLYLGVSRKFKVTKFALCISLYLSRSGGVE
jgi:hypothetical protein